MTAAESLLRISVSHLDHDGHDGDAVSPLFWSPKGQDFKSFGVGNEWFRGLGRVVSACRSVTVSASCHIR